MGDKVRVVPVAYPDKNITGTVSNISQVLDPQTKAMKIRIAIPNPDMMLKPEMFTRVLVNNVGGASALCVPASAVLPKDSKYYVVVMKSNNDLRVAEVEVIKTVGDVTYLRSGVEPGDVLVVKHQLFIFTQLTEE